MLRFFLRCSLAGILCVLPFQAFCEEESATAWSSAISYGSEETYDWRVSETETPGIMRLTTNILPWGLAIPNIGAEYTIGEKWSVEMDVMFCPWKISDRFSVKTVAILPEGRWWLKNNGRGSFFNVHLSVAWFNVRANSYRYQDRGRPLLGGGIGYGYWLPLNRRWAFEFEIGAGVANARYDRFYNVANGQLKDTRVSTYWGIDRLGVTLTYNLAEL